MIPITLFQLKTNYRVRNAQGMSNEAALMILSARDFGPLTLLRQGPITSLRLYLKNVNYSGHQISEFALSRILRAFIF